MIAELKKQLNERETYEVVKFCSDEAQNITKSLKNILPEGVNIKRTSLKTRNNENNPSKKEEEVLQMFQEKIDSGVSLKKIFHIDSIPSGYKFYKPLFMENTCLKCHGQKNDIDQKTLNTIQKIYPDDKAIGFKEHELRGIVVVEMVEGSCN